jgi:hypothetical protein
MSSITAEIDAVYAELPATGEELDAFRQGDAAVSQYAPNFTDMSISALVSVAIHTPNTSLAIEAAKQQYPDEFALGAMINAYSMRKAAS